MTNPGEDLDAQFRRHRAALTHRAPAGLEQRIFARLDADPPRASRRVRYAIGGSALAAFAAAALVLVTVGLTHRAQSQTESILNDVVDGHVRSMMADHLFDVVSSDQHTVKPWFEGKIDFAPTVKDFSAEGFPLLGGRLDYFSGHPVAALAYRSDRHFINVFEWPVEDSVSTEPSLRVWHGFQIYAWRQQSMEFWVVSDLNAVQLQTFTALWLK